MSRFVLTAQLQLQAPNNVRQIVQQIQSQLNGVNVNVQVQNSAQAQRQLQQITQHTNQATTAAERMGRAFSLSVRRFAAFSVATRAVGLFTSTLGNAVQDAIDFERQLVKVAQVTGQTIGQLRGLTRQINSLSTGLGVSSSDLLEVSTVLAQAGLSAEDTAVALRTLAKAALAPNFDSISETAEGAIAILAQFQEGVGALEKQLGSINAVAGAFAVEASDLIDVIRRTGGVFKASGGDLNELLALFTSVRATTRESAESIGTGLRTIFTRIQRPKTIEFLKQFGVELVDLNGKFVGPFEAIKRLSEALSGLGEGDLTFISIAEELGGFRQIGKVLPLLQQFSTAQSALNVAMKAGDSLTQDAASAQAALAIRIMKVKEEFLALIRSMTETSTFQIMANTALSLASALIKIADSIKPLLPMLAALAAVRLTRGIGGFFGGIMSGATSGRTYNKGGKVLGFARGGLVPGSGNRDTVPAMLAPGEFVIRKSSVNKMGAGTLAAMNENRYEDGGPMTTAQKIAMARGPQKTQLSNKKQKNKSYSSGREGDELRFSVNDGNIGAFFMNKEGTSDGLKPFKSKSFDITNSKLLSLAGVKPYKKKGDRMAGKPDTFSAKGILEAGNIQTFYPSIGDVKSGSLSQIIQNNVRTKLSEAVVSVANDVSSKKLLDIPPIDSNDALLSAAAKRIQSDAGAIRTTSGYLYEGVIDALTGARPASGNAVFDFPASSLQGNRKRLSALFGNESAISKLKQADAKASYSSKIIDGDMGSGSISSKIVNSINNGILAGINIKKKFFGGIIQRFTSGGMASAPLIDDILSNASGTLLPRPSSAIASLIQAGGGAIDIDRTLKRTIGDKAYASAKTGGAKDAVLSKYFRDDAARLNDIKSAPLTVFGKELQAAIKSGQINPTRLSIITKSSRTRGLPEYLNSLFGIPVGNMIFTSGGSKQPAVDAMRTKGPRSNRISRFATGGGVGTDTIPALLTPGEFVINRSSAQRIGYGALNRMNKVGKYAKGGVVQHFAAGTTGTGVKTASTTGNLSSSNIFSNFGANVAAVSAALQAISPPINESSTGLEKLTNSLLSLGTTIGGTIFALESFGIKLSAKNLKNIFGSGDGGLGDVLNKNVSEIFNKASGRLGNFGRALRGTTQATARGGSASAVMNTLRQRGVSGIGARIGGGIGSILGPTSRILGSVISKASGPLAAVSIINTLVGSFRDLDSQLKTSIESGKVEEASRLAVAQKASEFPLIGNIIGGWSETIDTGLLTIMRGFGGSTVESTKALAASQAGAVKTQKDLEQAQKTATKAMEDFERGSISASEALTQIRSATQSVNEQEKRASDFAISNTGNRAGGISGFGRNVASFVTFGAVESSSQRNSRLGKQSAEQIRQAAKFQAEAFQMESPARSAMIRSGFARGRSSKEIRDEALGVGTRNDKLQRLEEATKLVSTLDEAGDKEGADAAREAVNQLTNEINQINREMVNLEKEVTRAKAAFDAMNLGLRGPTSTANALSANMQKFAAGLEVGGNMFVANTEFLSEAVSSAAQSMNPNDIKDAISNVSKNLAALGLSGNLVTKFENNVSGFITAQQNYNKAFNKIRSNIDANRKAGRKAQDTPEEIKKAFAQELTAGLGGEAKKNLTAIIENIPLSQEEVDRIIAGDLSVFGDKLTEAGRKQIEEIEKISQERAKAEQVLIDFTKKRIDAERNLVAAQQEAIDLFMEGREIQGKYGGRAVTTQERRGALLQRSNVEATTARLGLSAIRTGSTGELRRRNAEIRGRFSGIESQRTTTGGMQGAGGVEADATQQDLQKAYKTQIETIKGLIKLEEEQLKIIEEKNKLERDSMESLVKGDVEAFFKQQAAVGATAAIASGDQRLMNQYGAEALGTAALDIKRQQEAGVQTLFGQQLAGIGGLTEAASAAALSSRGVTDMRAAQVMAGTTAEEEASKSRLRELGGMLGETGQLGVQLSEMEVNTAVVNLNTSQLKFNEILARGNKAAEEAVAMSRGGIIYANRGIFVPRGTDTVPAMLTPGEFVVNRGAVQRGNNLQILRAMNGGAGVSNSDGGAAMMARGGIVRYRQNGSADPEAPSQGMTNFVTALENFNRVLSDNVQALRDTKISIKLDSTSVSINLNDGGLLKALTGQVKQELFGLIENQFKVVDGGRLKRTDGGII